MFFIIIAAEIAIAAFRGTKKNIVRLICNLGCIIIAGIAAFIVSRVLGKSVTELTSADLTFGGTISKKDSKEFISIIDSFLNGTIAAVLFVIIYWVLKGISLIVTKILLKNEPKTGFNPVQMIFGLVTGLLCAGFTLMPYTGILQAVPNKSAATAAGDLVKENVGKTAGTLTRIALGSPAEKVSRYMGVGLLSNLFFNACTTAKTGAGSESMKEFLYPYMEKLEDIAMIADKKALVSEKIAGGSEALHAFAKTTLFKEKDKIDLLEDAVENKFPEANKFPEYKSVEKVAKDVGYFGKIAGIIEKSVPEDKKSDLLNTIKGGDLDIDDKNIEKLADYLYSMNQAEFYVREFFPLIMNNNFIEMNYFADFKSTKQSFITVLKSIMNIKRGIKNKTLSDSALYGELETIKYSYFFTDVGYYELLNTVKDQSGDDIPGYLYY